jgi:hypothetical protein
MKINSSAVKSHADGIISSESIAPCPVVMVIESDNPIPEVKENCHVPT